jgi:hypothetical protein
VETRLIELCKEWLPHLHPVKEIQGLAGGRNDLLLFEFNARKILFEVFGTASQVSRDLRILDNTKADVKIAIVIDREVDPSVFKKFLRENPEKNYPFLFVGQLLRDDLVHEGRLRLHELITKDETLRFARHFKMLSRSAFSRFVSDCKREGMLLLSSDEIKEKKVTLQKVLTTVVVGKLARLGIGHGPLKELARWLSKEGAIEYAWRNVYLGLNVYLYTDFKGNFGFYSDTELVEFLRARALGTAPHVLISVNEVISEVLSNYYKGEVKPPSEPRLFAGASEVFDSEGGRVVTLSVPFKTCKIVVHPPLALRGKKSFTAAELLKMIEIVAP